MELKELREQPVELLPGREALGRFSFKLTIAHVNAYNSAFAANVFSDGSHATALAVQSINIG